MDLPRLASLAGFAGLLCLTWWLGHRDEALSAELAATPLRLVERSAEAGIDFRHQAFAVDPKVEHIAPQVSSTGAGVSIVDVDGDGRLDLYATSSAGGAANALYVNQGDGTFLDRAGPAGLASLNVAGESASMGSLWGDVDEDGDPDVFVYAFGRSHLMRQDDGLRFTDRTDPAGLGAWANLNAATWIDYDRDGHLDLYTGGYFRDATNLWSLPDTRIMHDSFEFATDGGNNHLWHNQGDGTFDDVTAATGCTNTRWTYAALASDFDDDGWTDLYLANDYGSEELLLNERGRRFLPQLGVGLDEDSKSGMCVALGDVENRGRSATYVTNISEAGFLFQGNNLRLNDLPNGGPLIEVARDHAADCGWAWGAQFVDLDLDGWQDLFVANGFVSADPERSYWYDMTKIGGANGNVVADAASWPDMAGRSLSGYERSRVLRNLGGGRFRDVAADVGVDDRFDGRAVAVGDLFGDGAPDVLVANQRGPLLLYSNAPLPGRHWVTFDLVGTRSPREAFGATVEVTFGELVQRHSVLSSVGFSAQNDRRVHLGLGAAERVDRVAIRWPSGVEQVLLDLGVDQVHRIVEPME